MKQFGQTLTLTFSAHETNEAEAVARHLVHWLRLHCPDNVAVGEVGRPFELIVSHRDPEGRATDDPGAAR